MAHKLVTHRTVRSQHFMEKTSFNANQNSIKILNGHDHCDKMKVFG